MTISRLFTTEGRGGKVSGARWVYCTWTEEDPRDGRVKGG